MSDYQYKNFSELDFEEIKDSLKQYLSTQEAFVGFDFEGTAINTLLNVLAYNTQYNAFYLNMHASERFLATAQRRENVVALAKNLGYTPYSSKGSVAVLGLRATPKSWFTENKMTIPKHTMIKGANEDTNMTFYTMEAFDLVQESNQDSSITYFGLVGVFEGKKFTQTFTMTEAETGVVLPNKDVQTDRLEVLITSGSTVEIWNSSSTFMNLDSQSQVYFTEEVIGQKTRIFFGDNIIGKRPANGSTITVTYFTSSGTAGNNASSFTFADAISSADVVTVTNPDAKSYGAVDIESIESIRANAPLEFESQGRAVTANDFKTLLYKLVPSAHTVAVWGGEEELNAPRLGYVFLTWVTKEELDRLSQGVIVTRTPLEKTYVQNALRTKYSTVTIFPEVTDPQFIFLRINCVVYYDSTKTATTDPILAATKANIKKYYTDNISKFQTTLRYSKLSTAIDSASPLYVNSNDLSIQIYQEKVSASDAIGGIVFGIPVKQYSVISTTFTYSNNGVTRNDAYFSDRIVSSISAQSNELYLWYKDNGIDYVWTDLEGDPIKVGTIDRNSGVVTFSDFSTFDISQAQGISANNRLVVSAEPTYRDIDFGKNLLAVLRETDIKIQVLAD
jgi:hypothetical protein